MISEGKRILMTIGYSLGQSNVEVVGEFGRVGIPGVMSARVGIDCEKRDEVPRLYLEVDATCVDVVGLPGHSGVAIDKYINMLKTSSDKLNAAETKLTAFEFREVVMANINQAELEKAMRKTFDEFVSNGKAFT